MAMKSNMVAPRARGHLTYLVVPIRPLLGWLGWSRLCCSVAPILLTLTLGIIRVLRTWSTLGRTCKTVTPTNPSRAGLEGMAEVKFHFIYFFILTYIGSVGVLATCM